MDLQTKQHGVFPTPIKIFNDYIYENIKDKINDCVFVDMFCGSGNLILPLLEHIEKDKRIEYFKKHIFMFDILEEEVEKAVKNAMKYGIPENVAKENIKVRDAIKNYPVELVDKYKDKLFHITNPPYLSTHVIGRSKFKNMLEYFNGEYSKFTDMYQIALYNDVKNGVENMIYIIPSNFLFATTSVANIRNEVMKNYDIKNAVLFEKRIFEFTGMNVGIFYFTKTKDEKDVKSFNAVKIGNGYEKNIKYNLLKKYGYVGGTEFYKFLEENKESHNYRIKFKLREKEIEENSGNNKVVLYYTNERKFKEVGVNDLLYKKLKNNIIYARIVDGGSKDKRIGLYDIRNFYKGKCDGIVSLSNFHRVAPIEIFIEPEISIKEQERIIKKFDKTLEELRSKTDSDFLLTFQVPFGNGYIKKYMPIKMMEKLLKIVLS